MSRKRKRKVVVKLLGDPTGLTRTLYEGDTLDIVLSASFPAVCSEHVKLDGSVKMTGKLTIVGIE